MTDDTAPKKGLVVRVVDIADSVIIRLMGLAVFSVGIYGEVNEIRGHSVTGHIIAWACVFVFGAAFAFLKWTLAVLGGIVGVIGPYIPFLKKVAPDIAAKLNP